MPRLHVLARGCSRSSGVSVRESWHACSGLRISSIKILPCYYSASALAAAEPSQRGLQSARCLSAGGVRMEALVAALPGCQISVAVYLFCGAVPV